MAIVNLSGNFQPPQASNEVNSGNSLPSPSSRAPSTEVIKSFENEVTKAKPERTDVQLVNLKTVKEAKSEKLTKIQVEDQVEALQQFNQNLDRTLQFKVDDELGVTIVRVLDKDTEELIRQFPPEELLNLSRRLKDLNEQNSGDSNKTGILLQEKV